MIVLPRIILCLFCLGFKYILYKKKIIINNKIKIKISIGELGKNFCFIRFVVVRIKW